MHIVIVSVHVLPERVEEFRKAILENARNSILEPGITRFDVLNEKDDPTKFVLVEVYHTPEDQQKHRLTAHYLAWRDAVADMMAEPRGAVIYSEVYPEAEKWL